jgi:hypothetical protein
VFCAALQIPLRGGCNTLKTIKMNNIRKKIPSDTLKKILIWSDRHCCLCEKQCAINIEIHHIDGHPGNNHIDNLLPVCFDCHAKLGHYNSQHPKGLKYKTEEIKDRREYIYEKNTIKYLRPPLIQITNFIDDSNRREWGDFTFRVLSTSQDIPSQLKIILTVFVDGEKVDNLKLGDLYLGKKFWNINPHQIINGHFEVPDLKDIIFDNLRVQIDWTVIDIFKREHTMLPFSYVLTEKERDFYYDPKTL